MSSGPLRTENVRFAVLIGVLGVLAVLAVVDLVLSPPGSTRMVWDIFVLLTVPALIAYVFVAKQSRSGD